MINGGNSSIYVANMNRAIQFYTENLGLRLITRIEDEWAELDAGSGMVIGLHPANPPATIAPGVPGSLNIEFRVDESLDVVVEILKIRGVKFNGPIANYEHVRLASFSDPDGNTLLLAQNLD